MPTGGMEAEESGAGGARDGAGESAGPSGGPRGGGGSVRNRMAANMPWASPTCQVLHMGCDCLLTSTKVMTYYYRPHFTDRKAEARREVASLAGHGQSWDLRPDVSEAEPCVLAHPWALLPPRGWELGPGGV